MNVKFDLLTQPWVPVAINGEKQELSLKDVLYKAHDIDAITDSIPIVEFGLYRLLTALVLDIYWFKNYTSLEKLLDAGHFDPVKIDDYLDRFKDCFDLFDAQKPFLQTPDMTAFPDRPLAGLLPCVPSGTNSIHFHHQNEAEFGVCPAAAARLLTTIAAFMTAGGAGLAPSINGAPPWYVLINGQNLFEAICLNCFVEDQDALGLTGDAPPAWRNSEPPKCDGRSTKASLLEALTWRPRQIQLVPGGPGVCSISGDKSDVIVRSMKFRAGASCDFSWFDPSVPYKISNKGPLIMRPQEGKEIWRDTGPLMLLNNETYKSETGDVRFSRPRLVNQFINLVDDHCIADDTRLSITVYGMRTDMKMKVFEWQKERLKVPIPMAWGKNYAQLAQKLIDKAGTVEYHLKKAIKHIYPRDGSGNDKAFNTLIANATRQYWAELRAIYDGTLNHLADLISLKDNTREQEVMKQWGERVIHTALDVFDQNTGGFDAYGKDIRRLVEAKQMLLFKSRSIFETAEEKESKKKRKSKASEGGTKE